MKKMKLDRRMFCVVALLLAALTLVGCMNKKQDLAMQVENSPKAMQQSATAQPETAQKSAGRFDWTKNAAQIENRIDQISEVSDARVVVTGNTALVGVRFDEAYRGDMTERIREMVAAEVMAADPQITTVAVTADAEDVDEVYQLSERTTLGRDLDDLKDDINEIVRNATTLR